jgi:Rod binding domain-containing protein
MSIEPVLSSSISQPSAEASSTSSGNAAHSAIASNSSNKDSPAKIQQAASEFEGFFLAEVLKSAREASGSGLTGETDDDEANTTMIELGEQQFAQALASSGGLGIAKMITTGLSKYAHR